VTKNSFFPSMTLQPIMSQGFIAEASRSHSDTPHSVGLLWTNDHPFAGTCTCQNTDNRHIHAPGRIRTRIPSKRSAADSRRRPRSHWDRQELIEWGFKSG